MGTPAATALVPKTPALTSPLQEQHSPERGSSISGGLPVLPPSPTLVCKARAVFMEEKTLLWILLPTLIVIRLVFLPLIFVAQQDRPRRCYLWSRQATNLLFRQAGTDILLHT